MINGPKNIRGSPFIVKGMKNHNKKISMFAKSRRRSTFFIGSLAKVKSVIEIIRAKKRGKNLSETDIITENKNAANNFILGSSLWIKVFPSEKLSLIFICLADPLYP